MVTKEYKKPSSDPNTIELFDDFEETPVYSHRGKTAGFGSKFSRKKRIEHYINNI